MYQKGIRESRLFTEKVEEDQIMITINSKGKSNSLRFVVCDFFRDEMHKGNLIPGSMINLKVISESLGISMTPLREALVQMETEGFVSIIPRRGVVLNGLSLRKIRNIYSILGALEAVALRETFPQIDETVVESARKNNEEMRKCLEENDPRGYLARNNRFHGIWIDRTDNEELVRQIKVMKERLYEFPSNEDLIHEWEESSLREHEEILRLVERGDVETTANYLQFVHWSYENQEHFIKRFYSRHLESLEKKRGAGIYVPG